MKHSNLPFRIKRWTIGLCAGAGIYQVAGCDQQVSDVLTQGFTDASISLFTALITAFFTGLNQPDGNPVTTSIQFIEELHTFLA